MLQPQSRAREHFACVIAVKQLSCCTNIPQTDLAQEQLASILKVWGGEQEKVHRRLVKKSIWNSSLSGYVPASRNQYRCRESLRTSSLLLVDFQVHNIYMGGRGAITSGLFTLFSTHLPFSMSWRIDVKSTSKHVAGKPSRVPFLFICFTQRARRTLARTRVPPMTSFSTTFPSRRTQWADRNYGNAAEAGGNAQTKTETIRRVYNGFFSDSVCHSFDFATQLLLSSR